ncbi:uncharacterized protein LOC103748710 [Nannospalax galili]|uniref:uncharacterized protein LOC103748710 n=1 Tax=Nannospalax galili TaxID=1026970 RepID=UPI00111C6A6E|nr:uncharacterized protein LOC103748710 [Nannospalax galili]
MGDRKEAHLTPMQSAHPCSPSRLCSGPASPQGRHPPWPHTQRAAVNGGFAQAQIPPPAPQRTSQAQFFSWADLRPRALPSSAPPQRRPLRAGPATSVPGPGRPRRAPRARASPEHSRVHPLRTRTLRPQLGLKPGSKGVGDPGTRRKPRRRGGSAHARCAQVQKPLEGGVPPYGLGCRSTAETLSPRSPRATESRDRRARPHLILAARRRCADRDGLPELNFEGLVMTRFLDWDKTLKVSDKYLLSVVIAYFSCTGLFCRQCKPIHFFLALYLVSDVEEDYQIPKQDIFYFLYGKSYAQHPMFHKLWFQFIRSMGWRAWVSPEECEEIQAYNPDLWVWARDRSKLTLNSGTTEA